MSFTTKYFTFTDPITGELTKDYGFSYSIEASDIEVKEVDGVATIVKDEKVIRNLEVKPKHADKTEISENAFKSVNTSKESLTFQLRREQNYLRMLKYKNRYTVQPAPVSAEAIKDDLQVSIDSKVVSDSE